MDSGPPTGDPHQAERARMVSHDLRARGIKDERVLAVMGSLRRERFLPPQAVPFAYHDRALPVDEGQSISQPFIVAYMTEALRTAPDLRVLEIGTGTGYQTAVLAVLCRQVYTIERLAPLHLQARARLDGLGLANVEYRVGDGTMGWPEEAPFDRILVTAGAPHVPAPLVAQLRQGGVLIAPVGPEDEQHIFRVERSGERPTIEPLISCRFVKLIGHEGWQAG